MQGLRQGKFQSRVLGQAESLVTAPSSVAGTTCWALLVDWPTVDVSRWKVVTGKVVVQVPIPFVDHDPTTHLTSICPNKLRVMPSDSTTDTAAVSCNSAGVKVNHLVIPPLGSAQPVL